MRVATVEFSNMDDLPEVEMVDPNELDAVGIAYVIKHQDRIEAWLKAVAGYAVELMRAGRPIPGFKLVAGRKQRNWSEPEDEMRDIVLERTELELDTIAPRELLSVAKLEKLLKKKRFTTLFAEYVSETRGEPHIAPEDDPRPALNSAVEFLESPLE